MSTFVAGIDIQLDTPPNSVHPNEDLASSPHDDSYDGGVTIALDLRVGNGGPSLDRRSSFGSSSEESDNPGLYDEVVATDAETEDDNDNQDGGSDDEKTTLVTYRGGTDEAKLHASRSSKCPPVEYSSNRRNEDLDIANEVDFPIERVESILNVENYVKVESIDDIETQRIDFGELCNAESNRETGTENKPNHPLNISVILNTMSEGSHDSKSQEWNHLESVDTQVMDFGSSAQTLLTESDPPYLDVELQVNLVTAHEEVRSMSISYPTPDVSPCAQSLNDETQELKKDPEILEADHTELNVIVQNNDLAFGDFETIDGTTKIVGRPIIYYVIESRQKMDTVLTLADGKLGAHRMVLCAASGFLEDLLIEQDAKSKATLILPDITKKTMEQILMLSYTGKVVYSKDEEEDFYSAMKVLLVGRNADMTLLELPPRPKPDVQLLGETEDVGLNLPSRSPDDAIYEEVVLAQAQLPMSGSSNLPTCSFSVAMLECEFCSRRFVDLSTLQYHLDNSHRARKELATFNEIQVVSFCHGCNTQYKTLDRAQKCLTSHGLMRCWICFEVYEKTVIRSHYMTNHCDESSIEDAHNTFIRCRWCPRRINVTTSVAKLGYHCLTHVPQNQCAKGRRGRPASTKASLKGDDEGGVVFEESKAVDGTTLYLRYKTLTGEDTNAMEEHCIPNSSSKQHPPPIYEMNDSRKCVLNLAEVPFINIKLSRLPQFIEDKIFRRVSLLQTNPTMSAKSESKSTVSTSLNQEPAFLDEIEKNKRSSHGDRLNPSVLTGGPENEQSRRKLQGHDEVIVRSSQTVFIRKFRNLKTDQALVNPGIDNLVTPLRLFTHAWGHVNLLAQNLSKPHFTGFPENPILIIGSFSTVDIWTHIDGMKSKDKEVVILRLTPSTQSEASIYSSLYESLSSADRIGIISGLGITQAEFFICAFEGENLNRALQLTGNLDFGDKATNSLFAVTIPVQLQSTSVDSAKPQHENMKGKGQKRPFELVQTQSMTMPVTSSDITSLRRGRKRLKVVEDSGNPENEDVSITEVVNSPSAAEVECCRDKVHPIVTSISELKMGRSSLLVTTVPSVAEKLGENRKRKDRHSVNDLEIIKLKNLPIVTPSLERENVDEVGSEERMDLKSSEPPTITSTPNSKNIEVRTEKQKKKNNLELEAVNSLDSLSVTPIFETEKVEEVGNVKRKKKKVALAVNLLNPSTPIPISETENVEEGEGQTEKRKKKKKIELEIVNSSDPPTASSITEPENVERQRKQKRKRKIKFTIVVTTEPPIESPSDTDIVDVFSSEQRKKKKLKFKESNVSDPSVGASGEPPSNIENMKDENSTRRRRKKKKRTRSSSRPRKGHAETVEDREFSTLLSDSIERMCISSDIDKNETKKTGESNDDSDEIFTSCSSTPGNEMNGAEKKKIDWNMKLMESERNKKTRWKQTKLNLTKITTRSNGVPKTRRITN